jgi:FkbM family methyltransferase
MPPLRTEEFAALDALKCTVAYNRHGGYCVPLAAKDRPAAMAILAGDVYEPNTIGFMQANAGAGDIVHAGTFFGDFLPALSHALAPDARLWAFEPSSESHQCARVTVLLNDLGNVELVHGALGEAPGAAELLIMDADGTARGGASRLVGSAAAVHGFTETTRVLTIDDCVPADRHVSIIQLDVEGHEREALAGAQGTIRRCLPILILETLSGSTLLGSEWLRTNILALRYKAVGSIHGNAVLMPENRVARSTPER